LAIFRAIFKEKQPKLAKILRGGTQLNFDEKSNRDFDRKKQNWMVTKKAQLYVDRKKGKKKRNRRTPYLRQPRCKPHRTIPNAAGYA
jgi:hypothetical protein